MHEYELLNKERGSRICIVCSSSRIESAAYPRVIKEAALAIQYLISSDKEIAAKYELKYLVESKERSSGWGM